MMGERGSSHLDRHYNAQRYTFRINTNINNVNVYNLSMVWTFKGILQSERGSQHRHTHVEYIGCA